MKRFQYVALLTAAFGVFSLQLQEKPVYAASALQTEHAPGSQPTDKLGAEAYANHCAICHGDQRQGNLPAFPPLIGIKRQMTDEQITTLVHTGRGRMPGFPTLPDPELTAILHFLGTTPGVASAAQAAGGSAAKSQTSGLAQAGGALFRQNCAFCHGRDAMGGETGPDLTRSKLVHADVNGDKISEVVREGRPQKGMPAFNLSSSELQSIVAFIHGQVASANSMQGKRRGVDVADLQTGNVEAGKAYFNGPGGCAKCHSATGDLAGIASRYQGLQLEERMLDPRDVKSGVIVTLPSGKQLKGIVAYHDEFTLGMRDGDGVYHSWPVNRIKYTIDSPVDAHVKQFSQYTDADIHNLMAYLQTLR
ncbi:c-type cytochrome [Acidipila rosea]|uniref:Mono/diheme cytochrome c family protein n=1 Tax=Acidipila rosea TaxID=768535 RepID=A0A4R1L9H8_9BACT|nr:c-type cytochrome [Acidipila rosea]TCK73633.1 mono/diheme cytochrome c family protein [Acidipila rosea]